MRDVLPGYVVLPGLHVLHLSWEGTVPQVVLLGQVVRYMGEAMGVADLDLTTLPGLARAGGCAQPRSRVRAGVGRGGHVGHERGPAH